MSGMKEVPTDQKSTNPHTRQLQTELAVDFGPVPEEKEDEIKGAGKEKEKKAETPSSADSTPRDTGKVGGTRSSASDGPKRTLKREVTMVVFNRAVGKASKLDFDIDKLLDAIFGTELDTNLTFDEFSEKAADYEYEIRKLTRLLFWRVIGGMK